MVPGEKKSWPALRIPPVELDELYNFDFLAFFRFFFTVRHHTVPVNFFTVRYHTVPVNLASVSRFRSTGTEKTREESLPP